MSTTNADQILQDLGKSKPKDKPTPDPVVDKPTPKPDANNGKDTPTDPPPPPPVQDELTDEQVLAHLKKRGINVEKVDQIVVPAPSPADQEAANKKKKDAAFNYAITNNVYTKDDLISYEKDRDRPAYEFAFEEFKNNFTESIKGTAEEGTFNEADIRELFDEQNFPGENDDSPKRKALNARYEKIKNSYLTDKYGKILNAESVYENYETEIGKASTYKGIVDTAISKIPEKLTFDINGVNVEFVPSPEALQHVKDVYLNPTAYTTFGSIATEAGMQEAITHTITQKDFQRLLKETAESYHAQEVKRLKLGRIGVPPSRDGGVETLSTQGESKTKNADSILDGNKKKP